MFNIRSVSLGVKNELCERVVAPTLTYGVEILGMRMDDRLYLDIRNEAFMEYVWTDQDG